jgi:hypothetical protein
LADYKSLPSKNKTYSRKINDENFSDLEEIDEEEPIIPKMYYEVVP